MKAAELRDLGATVGYTHPVFSPLADGTPAGAFVNPRSVEARELVADAALGLVDSVDLLGPNDAAIFQQKILSGVYALRGVDDVAVVDQ